MSNKVVWFKYVDSAILAYELEDTNEGKLLNIYLNKSNTERLVKTPIFTVNYSDINQVIDLTNFSIPYKDDFVKDITNEVRKRIIYDTFKDAKYILVSTYNLKKVQSVGIYEVKYLLDKCIQEKCNFLAVVTGYTYSNDHKSINHTRNLEIDENRFFKIGQKIDEDITLYYEYEILGENSYFDIVNSFLSINEEIKTETEDLFHDKVSKLLNF